MEGCSVFPRMGNSNSDRLKLLISNNAIVGRGFVCIMEGVGIMFTPVTVQDHIRVSTGVDLSKILGGKTKILGEEVAKSDINAFFE